MTSRLNKDENISFQELEPISENEEIYKSILNIGIKKEKSKSPWCEVGSGLQLTLSDSQPLMYLSPITSKCLMFN